VEVRRFSLSSDLAPLCDAFLLSSAAKHHPFEQVDVGLASKFKEELTAKLHALFNFRNTEYDVSSLDVKLSGFNRENLKVNIFIFFVYLINGAACGSSASV